MNTRQPGSRQSKFLGLILVLLCTAPEISIARNRVISLQGEKPSEDLVKQRISFLMQRIIEQSRIKLKDGTYATTMPVLPSNDDLREVRRYGDQAVKVLVTYVNSTQGLEQHLSLRFLLEFQSEQALAAVQAFAERSKLSGLREEAVAALRGFPSEKAKPIVERISTNDPDADVRASARRVLASFLASHAERK